MPGETTAHDTGLGTLHRATLLDMLLRRRSRRFALGARMDAEPLRYESKHEPVPLSLEEEAAIVFAGTGVTGFALGDLSFGEDRSIGGGELLINQLARTIASPDGINAVTPFVINDDGAFYIRRPQDYPKAEVPELVERARRREFTQLYERARIRVADQRAEVPRVAPDTPPLNQWCTNLPGTTYFVLVSELTATAIALLFQILNPEMGLMVYDERNGYAPTGLKRFGRSKGGHLYDDPNDRRLATLNDFESYVMELLAVEQGLMLASMQLAAEALGLGSFPHYGAQKWAWFEALGFRMEQFPFSKLMAAGPVRSKLMSIVGKNPSIPIAVGLEVDGEPVIKPFCPPWYPSMEAAVHAFIDMKYAEGTGYHRDFTDVSPWTEPKRIQSGIASYTQENIDAVVAHCEYVYGRYGRFMGNYGPVRNLMAFQVHHIDLDFYDRFYKPGAYQDAHRDHFAVWHGDGR